MIFFLNLFFICITRCCSTTMLVMLCITRCCTTRDACFAAQPRLPCDVAQPGLPCDVAQPRLPCDVALSKQFQRPLVNVFLSEKRLSVAYRGGKWRL